MSNEEKGLKQVLLDSANVMRQTMGAADYMNYALGLIFYKHLSDKVLENAASALVDAGELEKSDVASEAQRQAAYKKYYADSDYHDDLLFSMNMDYEIKPEFTFTALVNEIQQKKFQLERLNQAFRDAEQSNPELLGHLFDDVDLYSTKLGSTPQKRNEMISDVMLALAPLNLDSHNTDTLGDAYEYLIGNFASDMGQKAGEFYTPQSVSKLLTRITTQNYIDKKGFTAYDPAMGSGSLLLNVKNYIEDKDSIDYYGQEIKTSTYNLARMNMIIHNIPATNQHLRNGDTLDKDWPVDEITDFDAVMMNPPYSQKWSADKGFLQDPRFSDYGVLAPKSKADYAFLLHGFYHLKATGTMGIVLPHGVLFRGAAEGKIREKLLEKGAIYAVIGLPAGIFYSTGIPTIIMILKKDRPGRDVLFIDGSKEFEKGKPQNIMTDANIERIFMAYQERKDVDRFCHVATYEEIQKNEFNLNIPRYVDTFEPEPEIDLNEVNAGLKKTDAELAENEKSLFEMMQNLTTKDEKKAKALQKFLKLME
ncbi:MAG: type I restriction-modification system subunit M [Acidaminococcus sp.]|jgi:type I restriction enzyme M protein|nr:type I restriction-modification system subunit M [Acidaminococcus sp.]MCI2099712.1 type I restriction-modification system subunit M [Acidaminococcus sp.]MCI2113883.1 type I restriction-modification system subunit M [Acidaminococcus sp.]MCI2115881.1 type I restriction-modification system subunit M [Acidaminococcus sp.]